jgi:hypothetical protein
LIARHDAATVFENVDFKLVAGPGDAVFERRVEEVKPLVAGGYGRIG